MAAPNGRRQEGQAAVNALFGTFGSASEHRRYFRRFKSRRKCGCGCGTRQTLVGMANGVALMSGCELHVRRWVRDGEARFAKLRMRKQMQQKLAELLAEEGRRFTDGLPF